MLENKFKYENELSLAYKLFVIKSAIALKDSDV